jgi:hypothetical protein
MISNAAKRSILRWTHLFCSLPILSYVYGKPADVQTYASAVRFVFMPLIVLSGFWMYAGVLFAIIGVALWLGLYWALGVGPAIVGQLALFLARKVWQTMRARKSG